MNEALQFAKLMNMEGKSQGAIAQELNKMGYKTATGRPFSQPVVSSLLRERSKKKKRRKKRKPNRALTPSKREGFVELVSKITLSDDFDANEKTVIIKALMTEERAR